MDTGTLVQHTGPLMGNAAEAERFAEMIDARLRRKWRRQHAYLVDVGVPEKQLCDLVVRVPLRARNVRSCPAPTSLALT